MPTGPGALPSLGLTSAPSSGANTGDALTDVGFEVDFGDKITGDGSGSASGGIDGIVREVLLGVLVAVLAKFAFDAFK